PAPAAHAADKASVLTPDQARRALDTLTDDKKRAEMIETLRAIANAPAPQSAPAPEQAAPAATPSAPASAAPASAPQSPVALTADSLGAQLLLTVSEQINDISHEIAYVARTLTHFPA